MTRNVRPLGSVNFVTFFSKSWRLWAPSRQGSNSSSRERTRMPPGYQGRQDRRSRGLSPLLQFQDFLLFGLRHRVYFADVDVGHLLGLFQGPPLFVLAD